MKVRTRLRWAFAAYIALLAGLSVYHVGATRRAVSSAHALAEIAGRLRATSMAQLSRVSQMSSDAQKFLVTGDSGYQDKLGQTMREFDDELRRLDSLPLSERERSALSPLVPQWNRTMALAADLHYSPGDTATAALARFQESLDRVHSQTLVLSVASQDAMARELGASERSERGAERASVVAATVAVLLSLVLSALLAKSIIEPLDRLAEGTREVSAGRFGHRLSAEGNDELALVAREFNAMTERLDELDRMKREFVSKVSHDLKTPLSSMQETTRVMLDEVPGPLTPKQRQLLAINLESGERLGAMLGKLLDLSRIESGLEAPRRVIDIRPVLSRSVERVTEGAAAARVALTSGDSPRFLVQADADALGQVFDNLIENALKFSPADGQVQVAVAHVPSRGDLPPEQWAALRRDKAPGAVLVTVADEGMGIPDEEKTRVFERFYQTDAGRAIRGRGVGLGLAIGREIVAAHGGAIWVADNQPRGSVFHVLLPAAERAAGATLATVDPSASASEAAS